VCGGNGTSCILGESSLTGSGLQAREERALQEAARNTSIIIGAVVAVLVIAVIATIAFFLYKRHKNPHWMVPKAMLEGINDGVAENPLYKPTSTWQVNRLN